ncbi:MAG: hypothetical protein M1833_002566 [Piccolia ochrophora]|nr:MAG: hypothetical protein M1833_002566 [Piccolia ochrophora]
MPSVLEKRQDYYDSRGWYYSATAVAVKWGVLAAIVVVIFAFFVFAYLHAQRRMKKGLPPRRYHRWFVSRRQLQRFEPPRPAPHDQFSFYQAGPGYNMQPMPPPAYNPNFAPPPTYQPPEGSSKTNPSQMPPPGAEYAGPASFGVNDARQPTGPSAPTQAHT